MTLPPSHHLPTEKLAQVFKSTSATYKYYWLLAIIELVEEGHLKLDKRKIFARMISNSWYTVNYFHVSFGKQDNIQMVVEKILNLEPLTIDEHQHNLNLCMERTQNKRTFAELMHLDKSVSHWFFTPWFPKLPKETVCQSPKTHLCRFSIFCE